MATPPIPDDTTGLTWVSHGISGTVRLLSSSVVIKKPFLGWKCKQQVDIERQIYERLGPHPHITKLLGADEDKGIIVLERLQCSLRQHLFNLRKTGQRPAPADFLRWAWQTAQAFQHMHARGVRQVDIGAYNVLLDRDGNAKLCDFAGSSLDGSEPTIMPGSHATHPLLDVDRPSVQSELFAFGSMLYEMETMEQPYAGKEEEELERLFGAEVYPDTSGLVLGEAVRKCWMREYTDTGDLVVEIRRLREAVLGDRCDDGPLSTGPVAAVVLFQSAN